MALLCQKPFRRGINEYGCGRCMPCRIRRRKLWTARLLLEARMHMCSVFVTLTYNAEHLPKDGSVSVVDVQNFIRKLRRSLGYPLRYFFVGEYGEENKRPHYHGIIFTVAVDLDALQRAWGLGFVHCGDVTDASAAYLVGYTLKGMTDAKSEGLSGKRPEFARMSLRPGIGVGAIEGFARILNSQEGSRAVARTGDVPLCYRSEGTLRPFGRYLRRKLRQECGFAELGEPPDVTAHREKALALTLAGPGAIVAREQKRQQDGWTADALFRRSTLKRRSV